MRKCFLPLIFVALHVGVAAQMNVGDALVCLGQQLQVHRGSSVAVRYILPSWNIGLTMGNRNVNVVLATPGNPGGWIHVLTPPGTFMTFAVLATRADRVAIDEDGYVLAAMGSSTGRIEVARIDPFGRQTTIRSPVLGGQTYPACLTVDVATGDWLVGTGSTLYRMQATGQTAVVTGSLNFMYNHDIVSDPRTGFALVGSLNQIVAVHLQTGVVVPLVSFPQTAAVSGVAYDRTRDDFLFVTEGGNSLMGRISRQGVVTTLLQASGVAGTDVEVYGRRNLFATAGNPVVGTTFQVGLSDASAPNALYVAAASLGLRPGIVTPIGIVDLFPGPLFWLSRNQPAIFRGFTGRLSAGGGANASIAIPPLAVLRGVRFYLSFVTFAGGRLATIANTAGFTIR